MVLEYNFYIHDKRWDKLLEDKNIFHKLIYNIDLELNSFDIERDISLNFVDDVKIKLLNKEYRNKDHPTNVLSLVYFSNVNYSKFLGPLGDIFLSWDTIASEAKSFKISFKNHFIHMLLHGTLHVLGFNHVDAADAKVMEDLESIIMVNILEIDPYKTHMF